MRATYLFSIIIILLFGCNKEYRKLGRGNKIINSKYSKIDTLRLQNYSIFNLIDELSFVKNHRPMPINTDSLVNSVVSSAFYKLDVSVINNFPKGDLYVDSVFYDKYDLSINRINSGWIKDIAGDTNEKTILVPFIYILNRIAYTGFVTSSFMVEDNGFQLTTWVDLIVFIVKNNEIIYSNHVRHTTESIWTTKLEAYALPSAPLVKQEHWDELVRLAMEDYMERLK